MIILITTLIVILGYLFSLFGWGNLVTKYVYKSQNSQYSFSVALGIAILILIGGLLNAFKIAYPFILDTLVLLGWILGLYSWFLSRHGKIISSPIEVGELVSIENIYNCGIKNYPTVIVLISGLFLIWGLIPTSAFNFHDDFHTYMHRPIQMLSTGTVGGDPFNLIGIDSLGAQAFLQAFVVNHFPLKYINAFDAVFCFIVSGLLIVELAKEYRLRKNIALIALLLFILINPQQVNISSVYSTVLMTLGLLYAAYLLSDDISRDDIKSLILRVIPLGLFIAALVTLKVTNVVFIAVFFFAFFILHSLSYSGVKNSVVGGALAFVTSLLFVVPWMAVHYKNIKTAIIILFTNHQTQNPGLGEKYFGIFDLKDFHLSSFFENFSNKELFWGGSLLSYHLLLIVLLLGIVISLILLFRDSEKTHLRFNILLVSSTIAVFANYVVTRTIMDVDTAIRYAAPSLIAVTAVSFLIFGEKIPSILTSLRTRKYIDITGSGIILILLVLSVTSVLFIKSFGARVESVYKDHTIVRFPISASYEKYNYLALNKDTKDYIRNIQSKTDKGKAILALISLPYDFDFLRNRIFTVSEPGLMNPWLDFSESDNSETFRNYLRKMNIRYVFWEYQGYGMKPVQEFKQYLQSQNPLYRKLGEKNLIFRKLIASLADRSKILFNSNGLILFDISEIRQ